MYVSFWGVVYHACMFILSIPGNTCLALDIISFLLSLWLNVMIYCTEKSWFWNCDFDCGYTTNFYIVENLKIAVVVGQTPKSFRMCLQFTTMLKSLFFRACNHGF